MMSDNKKVWSANLTAAKQEFLLELAVIANKKSDTVTVKEKEAVRKAVVKELNASHFNILVDWALTAGQIYVKLEVS